MATSVLSIAPADLAFLKKECPACYSHKINKTWKRPYTPFPSIFNKIDGAMKDAFHNWDSARFGLPPGKILSYREDGKGWYVKSQIAYTPQKTEFRTGGKPDALIAFDDGTWGIIDYKTSDPVDKATGEIREGFIQQYSQQLYCYKMALERPAKGDAKKVSWLGLMPLTPRMLKTPDTHAADDLYKGSSLSADVRMLPVPVSEAAEGELLQQISDIIDNPPEDSEGCRFCTLRRAEFAAAQAVEKPAKAETPIDKILAL